MRSSISSQCCSNVQRKQRKKEKRGGRERDVPILVPIDKSWHHGVGICACADEEEDDEEKGLEVEYCGLSKEKQDG
jgi:hypothetical protein